MAGQTEKVLTIDGENRTFDSTLKFVEVSEQIKKSLGPDRVMTDIFVDNKAIDLLEEETLNDKFFNSLGNVQIKTRAVREVYLESLITAPRICEALVLDAGDVKRFFEEGNLVTAQERVSEMTSLLEWLLQLISGFQAIGKYKLDDMKFSEGKVMDTVDRMQRLLAAMHIQFSVQNWNQFEVLLTTDFVREVNVWKKLFEEVSSKWNPQASAGESSVQ